MSRTENVLFSMMNDISIKIDSNEKAFSLRSRDYKDPQSVVISNDLSIFDTRGNGNGDISPTITGDHQNRVTDYTAIVYDASRRHNYEPFGEVCETVQAAYGTGGNNVPIVREGKMKTVVRRLTPLECERLQGYPDGWTDIGEWVDTKGKKHKDADSPRYKALGNSIALPFWEWMAERMINVLKKDGVIDPTMASLFDGIGGFPLVYSRHGCTPVWASEIEEFPIAVTKVHFGDNKPNVNK